MGLHILNVAINHIRRMGGRGGGRGEGGGIRELNFSKKSIKKYQPVHTGFKSCSDYHKKQLTVLKASAPGKNQTLRWAGLEEEAAAFHYMSFCTFGLLIIYTHHLKKHS